MKKGVTLVEVLVSSIILASMVTGIISTFVSVRQQVGKGTYRVVATNLAAKQLDSLYSAVRADLIDVNGEPLQDDDNAALGTVTLDNTDYDVKYKVTLPSGVEYREVETTVKFEVPTA